MKRMKKSALAILLVVVMGMLAGCGGLKPEDAKAYAQAILDASYKGEFKEYIKQTDSTEEEAEKLYEESIDETMSAEGFQELGMSDELLADYRQLCKDLAKQAKYSIGDAKETDNGFEVTVTVEPFNGFEGIEDKFNEVVAAEAEKIDPSTSAEEINELLFQKMYDLMAEAVANPTYGETTTVTLHVVADSEGVYSIPDDDLTTIDTTLFPQAF